MASKSGIEEFSFNFIPFIYQEKSVANSSMFMVFDIEKYEITDIISISPSLANSEYIHEDDFGYNTFFLCRSSDMQEININGQYAQRIKY